MKKILFALTVLLMAGTAMNAQKKCTAAEKAKCAKKGISCTKAKASTDATTKVASFMVEADALAKADDNIKREECEKSGRVSYFEKSVCANSGTVTWDEVEYDNASNKFSKVASASMERSVEEGEASMKVAKKDGKACCAKGAKKDFKACCAKGASKKSCSKSADKAMKKLENN